jgi:hypothetical protein
MASFGIAGRVCFAVAFLAGQAALIATGLARPDRLFAFQMFNESSTIEIHVARRVRAGTGVRDIPLKPGGAWVVRDSDGDAQRYRWRDRVRDPGISTLGRAVHASYGVDAQLFRLAAALDDAARHDPDPELVAFVADAFVRRNGRPRERVHLESRPK